MRGVCGRGGESLLYEVGPWHLGRVYCMRGVCGN